MIGPYGGTLIDRLADPEELSARLRRAETRMVLAPGPRIHLFNIATGCYSPLGGFMTQQEFEGVVSRGRLPSGHDWKVPILLHADGVDRASLRVGGSVALTDDSGTPIATIDVESIFEIDPVAYCQTIMGTADEAHPGARIVRQCSPICLGGPVTVARSARRPLRCEQSPAESRNRLQASGMRSFTAFSTRNICHRGHEFQHWIALDRTDLLGIHVITGAAVPGSFDSGAVLDIYEMLIGAVYPGGRAILNNLRLPPIYAGPKEAFLQATVLQNLGYSHFIVGRDHAGVGNYYGRYASQQIFEQASTLDIEILPLAEPHYCPRCDKIVTEDSCSHQDALEKLNGRDVRRLISERRFAELDTILRPEVRDLLVAHHATNPVLVN